MKVRDFLHQNEGKNYFEILNIPVEANSRQIRKARIELLEEIHPDSVSAEERDDAVKATSLVNTAFEALTDADFKSAYIQSGFKIKYGQDHNYERADKESEKSIEHSVSFNRRKGISAVGSVAVALSSLKKGGKVTAKNIVSGGEKLKDRKITLNPNTHNLSILVYQNMALNADGQDIIDEKENTNGDLLVYVVPKQDMSPEDVNHSLVEQDLFTYLDSKKSKDKIVKHLGSDFDETKPLLFIDLKESKIINA